MLEIKNLTPFPVALVPFTDPQGREGATVVVKGTFALPAPRATPAPLSISDEQAKIELADVPSSEPPEKASVRYAAESSPAKAATDVALLGHAYPARAQAAEVDVALWVGPIRKSVRIFGDRRWMRGAARWRPSRPTPFEKMPLLYERAFGGWDTTAADARQHDFYARNPVGLGFAASRASNPEGLLLPNLEDPSQLIEAPADRPAPAGFGFIAPAWTPRRERAGTYDDRWRAERFPFLPADFDAAFFQSSAPDLTVPGCLKGDEPVTVTNASRAGELTFAVPRRDLEVTVWIRGEPTVHPPRLDTFIIEPDAGRALCTWKSSFLCVRKFLYIDLVRVREVPA